MIMAILGQGNGIIGDYMSDTFYATIWLTPYQKPTDPGNNPAYPTGSTQAASEIIKYTWERDQFEFITLKNFQHETKRQIIAAFFPELLEDKKNQKKVFTGISGHELMEYLMVRYENITKPIKYQ